MLRYRARTSIVVTIYTIDDSRGPVQCVAQPCQYPNILTLSLLVSHN